MGRRMEVKNPPQPTAGEFLLFPSLPVLLWFLVSVGTSLGQHLLHLHLSSQGEGHGCGGKPPSFQIGSLQADYLTQAQGDNPLRSLSLPPVPSSESRQ